MGNTTCWWHFGCDNYYYGDSRQEVDIEVGTLQNLNRRFSNSKKKEGIWEMQVKTEGFCSAIMQIFKQEEQQATSSFSSHFCFRIK